jgi:hypothetical protein
LHAYAGAVGAVARAYAVAHPRWWHVSLKVRPTGLVTDPLPLPGGGAAQVRMDLLNHTIAVESSRGTSAAIAMNEGRTAAAVGDALITAVAELGFAGDLDRSRFDSQDERPYDESTAALMFSVFVDVATVLERHRTAVDGTVGIVQLWPHGFDLAMEWFGTRMQVHEENGAATEHSSQLNLGFYPGADTYFYSNPWPFESAALTGRPLPHGAQWHTEGWEGSILPYSALVGDPAWSEKLADYARAVFDAAAPTLS